MPEEPRVVESDSAHPVDHASRGARQDEKRDGDRHEPEEAGERQDEMHDRAVSRLARRE
ncbi:hypothetical protein D3C83_174560 [compost metagenome]